MRKGLNKSAQSVLQKFVSFAIIIGGGAIVSFAPEPNLKVLGGLLISLGVAVGSLM